MKNITQDDITERELSESEKAWLRDRDRHADVERNEEIFGRPVEEDGEEREVGVGKSPDDDGDDNYDQWKIKELQSEGEGRTPPVDFTGCTKKADYVLALRSWDRDHGDDNTEE